MRNDKTRIHLLLLCLIILASSTRVHSQVPVATGRVQGAVVTADGQPVPKASVILQFQGSAARGSIPGNTFTGDDGRFLISGLIPGTYKVCVQVAGSSLLNPCNWSSGGSTVAVASGQTASIGNITLEAGYVVKVRLNDSGQLLRSNEGKNPGAHIQIGVWTQNGLFIPLRIRTNDANARDLELPVPFGTPVQLSVSSGFFELADENNIRLDPVKGANISMQVPAGVAAKSYVFNVTGRKSAGP